MSDVPAIIKDGRTYLPLRAIAEGLGGQVDWDGATRTAVITKDGKEIRMTVDTQAYTVDGKSLTMDATPFIYHDRTVVPVRYLAEALGQFVEWDQDAFTVSLSSTEYGNTPGNIANWGAATGQGDWVYFSNPADSRKLYKIHFDGTNPVKLSDAAASQINARGNWVYWKTADGTLRKVRTDGTGETILAYGDFAWVQVAGDWIYYSDMWQKGIGVGFPLYKMRTDGTERTRLSDFGSQQINVTGDAVYFYAGSTSAAYLKTSVNGGEATDLKVPHPGIQLLVQDGHMYYWYPHWSGGTEAGGTIYRAALDGSSEEVVYDTGVVNGSFGFVNIDGGWIYYTIGTQDSGVLYRHRMGGNDTQLLSSESVAWVNILGDYIFCQNGLNGDTAYLLKKDGSQKIVLAQKKADQPQ